LPKRHADPQNRGIIRYSTIVPEDQRTLQPGKRRAIKRLHGLGSLGSEALRASENARRRSRCL
jgi:hypothetical protein